MRFVLLVVFILHFYGCVGQNFIGNWRGEIVVQGVKLPIIFYLQKDQQNKWTGRMVNQARSADKLLLSSVFVARDSIFLSSDQNKLTFEGRKVSRDRIEGTLTRGDKRAPLKLQAFVEEERRRPQTPEPPYTYDTTEVSFVNDFDQVRIAGTLTTPRQHTELLPAVVLVTGSGPQDRDESIEEHKPFKVIADYLTKRGIVVLRYDDRGIGKSGGNYPNSTIGDFSRDVIGAVRFLRRQKNVDPDNIGVIGHSEGALIAMLIAGQKSAEVNFIGLLAPPSIAIDSLMVLQAYEVGRSIGLSEQELKEARVINQKNFAVVKSDLSDQKAYTKIMKNVSTVFPNPTQDQQNEFKMLVTSPYRYFMRIDPVPFIKKIEIPLFAAFGTKDVQVPFAANLESLTNHLPKNTNSTLKAYDGLNHFFQRARIGSVSEYANLEETFSIDVLEDLIEWLHTIKN